MSSPRNLFWDSCVFIRWLTRSPPELCADIEQYMADAKARKTVIYFSTVLFTEVRPRFLKGTRFGSIERLFADLGSAFVPIDPTPDIMIAAGQLRDADCTNPGDPKVADEHKRSIGTPDAIQLMTCVYARDVLGLNDIVFHTFDDGKSRGWEGRCVPLLSFERWFPEPTRTDRVAEVCALKRQLPRHPAPDLVTSARTTLLPTSGSTH